MRFYTLRRVLGLLLIVLVLVFIVQSALSSVKLKCIKRPQSLRNFPILIVNHSDVAKKPKKTLSLSLLITPNVSVCNENIVVVHSHSANSEERMRLRSLFEPTSFHLLFVLGVDNYHYTESMKEEINEFDDLLIIDVVEVYHNITYKAQAWIRYLYQNCPNVRWIVKIDDDVEVNPSLLTSLLLSYRHYSRVLIGRLYLNNRVMRIPQSKWFLSHAEYSQEWLGEYLQGMSYVISGDLLSTMNENIDRVQYLWMDDWYVTHALLNGTSASLIDISSLIGSANSRNEVEMLRRRKDPLMFVHLRPKEEFHPAVRNRIWNEIQDRCD